MAFVVRSGRLVGPLRNYLRPVALANRCISTSNKKDETAVVTEKIASHKPGDESHVDVVATPARKKWMNYGFSATDETEDIATTHLVSFFGITVAIVGTVLAYMYGPDHALRDWAQREAYLLVREREAMGLPHIDPNYTDESTIVLPSEEELGDFEIII
uniref:NADH dehydrogenase [ubiquinone] 1 beta subcomplex subunit 11, mitochondrial n=1 Tax=Daphnia galeata TaxID=27404 RepID=A0A8J2RKA5_9CRUS|nr:unnamed protein product [Daphnia galeata]